MVSERRWRAIVFSVVFVAISTLLLIGSSVVVGFINVLFLGVSSSVVEEVLSKQAFVSQILAVISFACIVVFYRRIAKDLIWDGEVKKSNPQLWGASLVLAGSVSMIWSILTVNHTFDNTDLIQDGIRYFSGLSPVFGYAVFFLSVFIAAPIGEELLYRRMLVSRLCRAYPTWAAVLISSLLFGMVHIPAGGLLLGFGALGMGIVLGWIYLASGRNFAVVVGAHMIANTADFFVGHIPRNLTLPLVLVLLLMSGLSARYLYVHRICSYLPSRGKPK